MELEHLDSTGLNAKRLGQLKNLTLPSLYNCACEGVLPVFAGMSSLEKKLFGSQPTSQGPFPADAGYWWLNMDSTFAADNKFRGSVPRVLGRSTIFSF